MAPRCQLCDCCERPCGRNYSALGFLPGYPGYQLFGFSSVCTLSKLARCLELVSLLPVCGIRGAILPMDLVPGGCPGFNFEIVCQTFNVPEYTVDRTRNSSG
eukprot:2067129-Rhodomonas_salina.2